MTSSSPIRSASTVLACCAVLLSASCAADRTARPTLRVGGGYSDQLESELSIASASETFDTEGYTVEVSAGVTFYDPTDDGGERKASRAELIVGRSVYALDETADLEEDAEAFEVSAGGRYFFGSSRFIHPFLSVYATGIFLDEVEGVDLGTQIGLRAGGGVEFSLGRALFLDVGLDYQLPLVAAESDEDPFFNETIDTEVSGLVLRAGLGLQF